MLAVVVRDAGPIPRVKMPGGAHALAIASRWRAVLADARARLSAGPQPGQDRDRHWRLSQALHSAFHRRSDAGRMADLREFVSIPALTDDEPSLFAAA